MNGTAIRSGRIQTLTKMLLNGKSWDDLRQRCVQWGVSKTTMNSYLDAVDNRIKILKAKASK